MTSHTAEPRKLRIAVIGYVFAMESSAAIWAQWQSVPAGA